MVGMIPREGWEMRNMLLGRVGLKEECAMIW